jgi:hypothetical protein
MLLTVEGIYKDGKVEVAETPAGVKQAKVLVTFLTPETTAPPRYRMVYGQFAGERMSSEEDFLIAEWRGEVGEQDGD